MIPFFEIYVVYNHNIKKERALRIAARVYVLNELGHYGENQRHRAEYSTTVVEFWFDNLFPKKEIRCVSTIIATQWRTIIV